MVGKKPVRRPASHLLRSYICSFVPLVFAGFKTEMLVIILQFKYIFQRFIILTRQLNGAGNQPINRSISGNKA